MGRRVGGETVIYIVENVVRTEDDVGSDVAQGDVEHDLSGMERTGINDVRLAGRSSQNDDVCIPDGRAQVVLRAGSDTQIISDVIGERVGVRRGLVVNG